MERIQWTPELQLDMKLKTISLTIKEALLLLPNNRITFNGLQLSLFIQTVAGGGGAQATKTRGGTPTPNSLNPLETTVEDSSLSLSLSSWWRHQ